MAELLLHHYLLEIIGTVVLPLELQIPTLVILDIQALLVKTDTIINMDSPLRKGPSPSNLDQGHILSLILGEIEMQYPLLGLSAPIHNVPKATLRPLLPQMAFVLDLGPRVEKKCAVHLYRFSDKTIY